MEAPDPTVVFSDEHRAERFERYLDALAAPLLAIAKGQYEPAPDEPKVWFTSMESLAQILSAKNQALLELIARARPASITELAQLSGRAKGNLARTLRTMSRYGLVELHRKERGRVEPRVALVEVGGEPNRPPRE